MTVYAESSAVLAWLLGEARGAEVRSVLESASFVVTSDLTLVECDRALQRALTLGQISMQRYSELRSEVGRIASRWTLLRLSDDIVARARERFPEEPIRSLDALHLASAIAIAELQPETSLLTFDSRVGRSGEALGLRLALPLS